MRQLLALTLTIAACGGNSVRHIDATPVPDAPPDAPSCVPSGTPVMHTQTITASETWASGIHVVPATIAVTGGILTIEGCTQVQMGANASIELSPTATLLETRGSSIAPISFVRLTSGQAWGHLLAFGAALSLSDTTLTGGGTTTTGIGADQFGATIAVRAGNGQTLPQLLTIDTVTVTGSTGVGVFMNGAQFEPGSTALTVTGSGQFPVFLGADSANDLPDGVYTGNAIDAILLQNDGTSAALDQTRTLLADVTLHDRGVPYQVGTVPTQIRVGDGVTGHPAATLTIEAGVTLRFPPQAGNSGTSLLQIVGYPDGSAQGALIAAGTAAKPIIFTSASATPAAGDWFGIAFDNGVAPTTMIDHAKIEFAGGPSLAKGVCEYKAGTADLRSDSAVLITVLNPPAGFVTNTAISDSAGAGVHRGWSVTDVDFLSTNTFTNIAGCRETNVPNIQNICPTTACQ